MKAGSYCYTKGGIKVSNFFKIIIYSPISLGNTIGKIFGYIVNERIKWASEIFNVIGEEQNGFRKYRRGEDNIYVIREIIDKHNRENVPLYLAFLDIEKAYDRVNGETLEYIMEKIG